METIVPTMATAEASLARERPADPCILVIFGASGDLTQRLLIPSLYNLARNNLLPENFVVIGAARSESSHEDFRSALRSAIHESTRVGTLDTAIWETLEQRLYYVQLSYDEPAGYTQLDHLLKQCDRDHHTQNNYLGDRALWQRPELAPYRD
jgi:glucose-6-phosphate 1-dehydrogenase